MSARERYGEGRTRLMPVGLVTDGDGGTLVYPVDKGSGATTSLVEADGVVTVDADTDYLDEGERVEVQLFSPDVRPPALLGVGEDDPALSRVLDAVSGPRYLSFGTREGLRRLRDGLPDIAVASGPLDRDVAGDELASWTREWGLVTAPDGPDSLADLVDGDYRFVNRDTASGLRTSLNAALSNLAADRDTDSLTERIDGYDFTVKAHASPPRKVREDRADAGLGLRATADDLGLDFVPLGTEQVRVFVNSDRREKPGVSALTTALADLDDVLGDLPGYDR